MIDAITCITGIKEIADIVKNTEIRITMIIDLILFHKKFCLSSNPYNSVKESLNLDIPLEANQIHENKKIIVSKILAAFQSKLAVNNVLKPGIMK